jgi:hypothetical protein
MPTRKRKKASQKIRTLANKSVSAKKAGDVKGGFKSCAAGAHYNEATITVRKAGGDSK